MPIIICPECGRNLGDRCNTFGTYCVFCQTFISPSEEPRIFKEIEINKEKIKNQLREYIRKYFGVKNGNKKDN